MEGDSKVIHRLDELARLERNDDIETIVKGEHKVLNTPFH